MSKPGPLPAQILVTTEVTPEQEQAIIEAFGVLGVVARARTVPMHRGAGELSWLVLVALPLHAFLSTLGSTLAEEPSQSLQRLIGRTLRVRREAPAPPPVLVLQDAATRIQVVLESDLPIDAYRELVSLDLSTFRTGPLHYDQQHRRWRSELDEWQRRQH
jgi:hypothetical protein